MKNNKKNILNESTNDYVRCHQAVLVDEVVAGLNLNGSKQIIVDVTLGAAGHTEAILKNNDNVKVIGIDWDDRSLKELAPVLIEKYGERINPLWGNFAHIYKILKKEKISQVDGILADFGTSQDQIYSQPGFSFKIESKLDMRMSLAHSKITAYEVVNYYSFEDLSNILFNLGEESFANKIAKKIIAIREKHKIRTTTELAKIVIEAKGNASFGKIHSATKTFQALRIFVNKELENINSFLKAVPSFLKPGGRLVCISFHSLEDRAVKNFLQEQESLNKCKILTKKIITASSDELLKNQSSRSAKLRIAEFFN